jgi:hypothetical protein
MRIMALVAVSVLVMAAGRGWSAEAQLPLNRITAFSSGVAYYEHNGNVTDDAEVLLSFKGEQINDVLKSLTMIDLGGGEIGGMNYASREPLERALKNFGIDLSGEPTLGQILRQIRGASAVVSTPEKVSGKIVGVETRTEQILPSNTVIQKEVLNLLTAEGVKAVPLDTVSGIALADEKLNSELNQALAFLVESRDTNRKPVRLSFRGKGERQVRVGYINEAPVWKTSYRLVFGGATKNTLLLQGWAIVENTSDADWKNVELTLVSGRPISFIQDLYTPLYAERPEVKPELYSSLRPQVYGEGMATGTSAPEAEEAAPRYRAAKGMMAPPAPAAEMPFDLVRMSSSNIGMAEDMASVKPAASGAEVGELFSYRIANPVTLPRSGSAMLPIINQDVSARKVSIYNASVLGANPLNGLWLTNDTGLSLLAGPVTVFEGGTYAGDARIDNLPPQGKRLLSYAIDLKVKVDSSQKSSEKIVAAKISKGVLEVSRRHEYKQEYALKNTSDAERTLVIEHPRRTDLKLLEPAEPAEKTESHYRFETPVKAMETTSFKVVEERTDSQTVAILPGDTESLLWYTRQGEIPEKVKDALKDVIKRKKDLSQAERELGELEKQVKNLRGEQEQVRANMKAVTQGSQAYVRFEKKLLELESRIEGLQEQIAEKRGKVEELRQELAEYVGKLNVE